MNYVLFRRDQDTQEEFEIAGDVFGDRCVEFRSQIPEESVVIGRYSCLPFYEELERELAQKGSRLINSYAQHKYIANMSWAGPLSWCTPGTEFNVGWKTAREYEHGWVVKGRTNSRKFRWKTHMRAETRDELRQVMENLYDDSLIADQGLAVREYIPLEKVGEGINGLPLTNEWRLFYAGHKFLAGGFYWSIHGEDLGGIPDGARRLADKIADFIDIPFVVIDVAKTQSGDWILIELNDGQMSGLSCTNPYELYENLKYY